MTDWDVMLVSHEASRTGAPRVAVELAKGFVDHGLRVLVVLRWDGPIRSDFESTGAKVVFETGRHIRVLLRRFRISRHFAVTWEVLMARLVIHRYRPAAVYLNTALSLPYAAPAIDKRITSAVHLHEVDDWLSHALDRYPLTQEQAKSVRWAHCAQRSANMLQQRYPGARSQFIPFGIDADRVRSAALKPGLGKLPAQYLVNCATADHRKGVDVWLRLCESLYESRNCSNLHYVWVGKVKQDNLIEPYRNRPFFKHVCFAGEIDNPHPILKNACLMVLTSRQDAYPLVVLEAQALGVPVVAFDVGDIKDQIPPHHLVRAEDEEELLATVQRVLAEQPPVLAFDNTRHGIAVARQRALELLSQNNHRRIDS